MLLKRVLLISLLFLSYSVSSDLVYRCTDPVTKIITFTDRVCANTGATKLHINEINTVSGITKKEKQSIQQLDKRLKNKKSNQRRRYRRKDEKAAQEKRCVANQLRIDKIHIKLRQGYKSKKYDYYHNKLRPLKSYRNRYCT